MVSKLRLCVGGGEIDSFTFGGLILQVKPWQKTFDAGQQVIPMGRDDDSMPEQVSDGMSTGIRRMAYRYRRTPLRVSVRPVVSGGATSILYLLSKMLLDKRKIAGASLTMLCSPKVQRVPPHGV